ncbi:MAG TPA: CUAEP/CCAEP-tail radical SAM protein [Vicinamibacterales bacterium]|nr:CUAEP/CCAEP-tail radical SAM protein [Vicinamibacterales bacterium]
MSVLLLSTYEMGRQPFGLASPAAWLERAGLAVRCVDLSRDRLSDEAVREATLVAWYLPMHTATRLAAPVIDRVRRVHPDAHRCAYGLYAPLNAPFLRARGIDTILGPEFEGDLVALARDLATRAAATPTSPQATPSDPSISLSGALRLSTGLPRLSFLPPERRGLPPLDRYAAVQMGDGTTRVAGYTEASRGCRHTCRHCPIVPIYGGTFRVVQPDVVLGDVRAQVAAGARHITFGDPDFLNGPRHALRIVEALAREHPGVTYDVTVKVEHLLRHAELLPRLRETGCLFVTTAVEAVDDRILARLDKGHTRDDFFRVVDRCRAAGLVLSPTFVAFNPWITVRGYCDLIETIAALDLMDHVAPIQLAIRLIVTQGSRLLDLPEVRARVGAFDPEALSYPWAHDDPAVDALQHQVMALVGLRPGAPRRTVFAAVRQLAHAAVGSEPPASAPRTAARARATVPYLNEPWYC